MAVCKWVVKGSVRDCEIDEKAVEKVRELVKTGRRGGWEAFGYEALHAEVDGDNRSDVDTSHEPFYIYSGQSLEEAVKQAKEWLAGEDVTVYAPGGLERIAYSFVEIEWLEDGDEDDYESDGEFVIVATGDNLPDEFEKAWTRALRDYQRWYDYESEDYGDFRYYLELAGGSLDD